MINLGGWAAHVIIGRHETQAKTRDIVGGCPAAPSSMPTREQRVCGTFNA
jgi:hypothetical protein